MRRDIENQRRKVDFFCERHFFPSFDSEIFLNDLKTTRKSKHQNKTEEKSKKNERKLLLLLFFLFLFFIIFFPPSPRCCCLFEEERRKMEGDDGFGGRRRRASPSSPTTKKKKKTSSSSSLLPLLLRIFFFFIFGVVVLFGVGPALLTKNRLLSSKSFSNPLLNHHQNNDFVPELTCGAKVVENINEEYLHDVLTELNNQTFFRLFRVDLTRECKFWQNWQNGIKGGGKEGKEEEEGSCSAPPASFGNGKAKPSEDGLYFEESNDKKEVNADVLPKTTMCSLSTEPAGFDDIFGSSSSSSASSSKASIPRAPFSDPVDTTITSKEDKTTSFIDEEDCSKNQTSPKFWLDICTAPENKDTRKIEEEEEEHSSYVNLRLNPERWTGYNGSHVWKAIYEENCLKGEKKEDGLCYEERVLYRLLSGMHASVNIHVALHANPPQSEDEEWLPDPARFAQLFENHPERLKNLHFSFVVMLRALRKATPALAKFPTDLGQDTIEDEKTRQLKMKLLDSPQVLGKSCEELFNAFDEARLFNDVGVASEVLMNSGGSDKMQFKDIFRNITEVIDCVACQKCRLHGKLQILGIGTALKILLLPEEVLMNEDVITRSEFVAMINTIAKFSRALMASSHFAKTKNLAL